MDASDGLLYYGARYYDAQLGRFISADTIVPSAGNPQSLNRYSYALNNPVRYTDPSGHCPETPRGAGRVICVDLFIALKNVIYPFDGAGDGRDFTPKSNPDDSRFYVFIMVDEGKYVVKVNDSHLYGIPIKPLDYPANDITVQFNNENGEITLKFHATNSIDKGKVLGSIDGTVSFRCTTLCGSKGRRDAYPWFEAYLYDEDGNLLQTIAQRPGRILLSLLGSEQDNSELRQFVQEHFPKLLEPDEWDNPVPSPGVYVPE